MAPELGAISFMHQASVGLSARVSGVSGDQAEFLRDRKKRS
jgi:hypothetical protein